MPYSVGLVQRKHIVGQFDSDFVVLMKKAGAILLAVTNVSELAMWWESHNHVYGRSCNPYDSNRIVGGSSGGEVIQDKRSYLHFPLMFYVLFRVGSLLLLAPRLELVFYST